MWHDMHLFLEIKGRYHIHYMLDDITYTDDLGKSIPFDQFYKKMEDGAMTKTSPAVHRAHGAGHRGAVYPGLLLLPARGGADRDARPAG